MDSPYPYSQETHQMMSINLVLIAVFIGTVSGLSCTPTSYCDTRSSQYDVSSNIFNITAVMGIDKGATMSVAFDPERNEFVYIEAYTVDNSWRPGVNRIQANYADESVTDPGYEGKKFGTETLNELLDTYHPRYAGGEIANDMLYLVEEHGRLLGIELETHDVINYAQIGTDTRCGYACADRIERISSVCIDEVAMMAYVVDGHQGALYRVDIANDTGWNVETISPIGGTITDVNGANPRVFKPQDCTVMNDKVYMAEQLNGALGVYDIDADSYVYDADVLGESANTIVSSNGILVVGNTAGDIFIYDCCDSGRTTFQNVATFTTIGSDWLYQVTIDWMNGVIVGVIGDSDTSTGYLLFIQSDDLIVAVPSDTPTPVPTRRPTCGCGSAPVSLLLVYICCALEVLFHF
eukprot:104729_1